MARFFDAGIKFFGKGRSFSEVYLEINRSHVFISTLQKKGDYFYCDIFEEQLLCSLEVCKEGVYNPSVVSFFIENFLKKNNLVGAGAVVCCPYLARCERGKKEFACFQAILCACKAGLRVDALFDERILMEKH